MTATKNILIVEDEPLIAMMVENFLEVLDREVAGVADTVVSALHLLDTTPVDVVILDRNLRGGESSAAVAEELDRRGIPFVIASGGGMAEEPAVFRGRPALAKPFTLSAMEKALEAL